MVESGNGGEGGARFGRAARRSSSSRRGDVDYNDGSRSSSRIGLLSYGLVRLISYRLRVVRPS
eukprot:30903-Pelagococcus_subviridis.AAC.8